MAIYYVFLKILAKKMNEKAKQIIDKKLHDLSYSKFRSSFHLRKKELDYLHSKGYEEIKKHARDFIKNKLADAYPKNDGAQTPMKNHPVFIAEHATATCCRSCLEKWHHIKKGHELTINEQNYIVELVMEWIKREDEKNC